MKNTGSVNNGKRGADKAAAAAMTAKTTGKKRRDRKRVTAVDPRRCFLSVQEEMSRVKTKYNLLHTWYQRSRTTPAISSKVGTPRVVTVELDDMVVMTMWMTDTSSSECAVLCQAWTQQRNIQYSTTLPFKEPSWVEIMLQPTQIRQCCLKKNTQHKQLCLHQNCHAAD